MVIIINIRIQRPLNANCRIVSYKNVIFDMYHNYYKSTPMALSNLINKYYLKSQYYLIIYNYSIIKLLKIFSLDYNQNYSSCFNINMVTQN